MKRDMDIVRNIMLATSELPPQHDLTSLENIDADTFAIHVIWLQEAGLISASVQHFLSGTPSARVHRLTWDGCDFADAARNDTLWNKAKEVVIKPTASFTFGLLKDWLAQEVKNGFPALGRAIQ